MGAVLYTESNTGDGLNKLRKKSPKERREAELTFNKLLRNKTLHALVVGFSLLFLGILFSSIPTMIASQNWPSTNGKITSRTMLAQRFKEYDGDYYQNIDGYIRYEYRVDGKLYSSTVVNSIRSQYYPYQTVLKYPEGKDVLVYYHPRNPARALLEPGWVFSSKAIGFFPSLMIIAGLTILGQKVWFSLKRK